MAIHVPAFGVVTLSKTTLRVMTLKILALNIMTHKARNDISRYLHSIS
jgi:hypothetical protein